LYRRPYPDPIDVYHYIRSVGNTGNVHGWNGEFEKALG
jgi:hypothetical protein